MIFFLVLMFILLLFISYYTTGKDFFSPACIMLIAFIFSGISTILSPFSDKVELCIESCLILLLGMLIIIIVNGTVHRYYLFSYPKAKLLNRDDVPLSLVANITLLAIVLINIYFQIQFFCQVVGSDNIFNQMYEYRMKTSYGNGEYVMPWYLSQLDHLTLAIVYLCSFNLIFFWEKLEKSRKSLTFITILAWCIKILLNASRFEILSLLIGIVFIFYMKLVRKKGGYGILGAKSIIQLMLIALISLSFFYFIAELAGRKMDATFVEYITSYSGTQIPNFDLFIREQLFVQSDFPGETLYSLLQWLRRYGLTQIPIISIHKEFRTVDFYDLGNTYTAFRDYYHDFGLFGVIAFHSAFSFFTSILYEKGKKKMSNWSVLFQSMIYGCIPLYMFNNLFFGLYISPTFIISILELYIMYFTFVNRKWQKALRKL